MPSHLYQGQRFIENMKSLIGEDVSVVLETIDGHSAMLSLGVRPAYSYEVGAAAALHRADLIRIRNAINRILGETDNAEA